MSLEQILSDLRSAQHALKRSSDAFDDAMKGMRLVLDAIDAANHAQGAAIDAVVSATDAALLLVRTKGGVQ